MLSKVAAYAEANHHRAVRLRVREPDGEWLFGVNPDGTGFELADDTQPTDDARKPNHLMTPRLRRARPPARPIRPSGV